ERRVAHRDGACCRPSAGTLSGQREELYPVFTLAAERTLLPRKQIFQAEPAQACTCHRFGVAGQKGPAPHAGERVRRVGRHAPVARVRIPQKMDVTLAEHGAPAIEPRIDLLVAETCSAK